MLFIHVLRRSVASGLALRRAKADSAISAGLEEIRTRASCYATEPGNIAIRAHAKLSIWGPVIEMARKGLSAGMRLPKAASGSI